MILCQRIAGGAQMDLATRMSKMTALAGVFQPRTPITSKELLAGRLDQLRELFNTALQPGQHVAFAAVAQMAERGACDSEVDGSIPVQQPQILRRL